MNKQASSTPATGWFSEMFRANLYKKTQGKIARQVTFFAIAIIFCVGAYRVTQDLWVSTLFTGAEYIFGGIVLAGGLWFSYRIVNYARFADFLIAVEAEMNKVSWPTKQELIRSSIVVIFIIFFMAAILFLYDIVWENLFRLLKVKS